LLAEELVLNASIFEAEEDGVLLVYTLDLLALHLVEHTSAVLVVRGDGLVLQFVVFDVNDLFQMENIIHSLEHVAD